jgi:hypothetical protein
LVKNTPFLVAGILALRAATLHKSPQAAIWGVHNVRGRLRQPLLAASQALRMWNSNLAQHMTNETSAQRMIGQATLVTDAASSIGKARIRIVLVIWATATLAPRRNPAAVRLLRLRRTRERVSPCGSVRVWKRCGAPWSSAITWAATRGTTTAPQP